MYIPLPPSVRFYWSEMPADRNGDGSLEDDLTVRVDDVVVPAVQGEERAWSVGSNGMEFKDGHIPPQGATVELTYWPASC